MWWAIFAYYSARPEHYCCTYHLRREAGLKVAVSLLITGLVSALTIGGKAAGKGIAVMCSSKVLAICGRVLSVLPLKLDNRK
ncbi:MAG: hypothetical protein ACLT2F_04545 [Butyricicoccus sp.]